MKRTILYALIGSCWIAGATLAEAQTTTDPTNHHAYGANIGWLNAAADGAHGLRIAQNVCAGHLYGPSIGWIGMGDGTPADGVRYSNTTPEDYGVNCGEQGELTGYAYAANAGWLSFEQTFGRPRVNAYSGQLEGHVWSANLGWLSLSNALGSVRVLAIAAGDDADGDAMPDWWEYQYYGATNASVANSELDSDGDGLSNWQEWRVGTDPTDPGSTFQVSQVSATSGSVSQITITWPSVHGKRYALTAASELGGTWTTLASNLEACPPMNAYTVSVETASAYWRVRVE